MADTKNKQSTKKKVDLTPTDNSNIFLFDIAVPAESVKDAPKKPASAKASDSAKAPSASKGASTSKKPAPEKKRPQQSKKLNEAKGAPKKLAKEKKSPSLATEEVIEPKPIKKKNKLPPAPALEKPVEREEIKIPYVNKKPATKRDFSDGAKAVQNATKELPKVLAWFIPTQNDKMEEIIRKGLVIICIIVLIFSMGILIKSTHLEKKARDDNAGSQFVNKYVYSYEIYDKQVKEK